MQNKEIEHEWKKDAPSLAEMERENPFSVPLNYFEELSDKIKSNSIIEAARFEQEKEFNLTPNYFSTLESKIKSKIEDLDKEERFLHASSNLNVNKKNESDDKIVSLNKGSNIFKSWIRYGVAASISIIFGTVVYLSIKTDDINKQLTKVSDQEIIEYLQIHSTIADNQFIIENLNEEDLQQVSNDISIEEIEQYIDNNSL